MDTQSRDRSAAACVLGDERVSVWQFPAVRLAEPAAVFSEGCALDVAGRAPRSQAAQMARDELDASHPFTTRFGAAPRAYHPRPGGAVADERNCPLSVARREMRLAPGVSAAAGRFQKPFREEFRDGRFQGGGL